MRTKRLSFLILLLLFGASGGVAQQGHRVPPVAEKLDEYEQIRAEDHAARLDNFVTLIQTKNGWRGCVIAYGPEGEGYGTGKHILQRIQDYFVNTRGVLAERMKMIYGGPNDVLSKPRIQLWVVPAGASLPKAKKFKVNRETVEGLFVEAEAYDSSDFDGSEVNREGESGQEPVVDTVIYRSIADVLKNQKTSLVYVVAYNGEDASPGAWQRVAQDEAEELKKNDVEANRVKLLFGGTDKVTKVLLWIKPVDAAPPIADAAGPEPPPRKTVQLFDFDDESLGDAKLERSAFKRLVDTLRQFPTLQACVVVRFGTYVESPQESEEMTPQPTDDEEPTAGDVATTPKPADVAMLVEKWKTELSEVHKMSRDRLIILFNHSDDFSNNSIETWLVPPGGKLPNPAADREDP